MSAVEFVEALVIVIELPQIVTGTLAGAVGAVGAVGSARPGR